MGVSLTNDRFGNRASALYLHGNPFSYVNLGTSPLLKPRSGTISLWANLDKRIHLGKGYDNNPILFTRNSEREDFYDGYVIGHEPDNKRLGACITLDSTSEVSLRVSDTMTYNKWYHVAITFDDRHMALYLNGKLEAWSMKNFTNRYSPTDSVMVGIIHSRKNQRFMLGTVDDIKIFHRVLRSDEIMDLYKADDPNKLSGQLQTAGKYLLALLVAALAVIAILLRNRSSLKRHKEQLELSSRISQLELKAVKAQINPHFISNSLVAVQHLIYDKQVETAAHYIARFSFYLRQVLKYSDENYITLSNEIEMIRLYIELEQLRFDNQFVFHLSVAENIDQQEAMVPSLITQTFLENAIWHGLLPLKGSRTATLTVSITGTDQRIIIEITDNGIGRQNGRSSGTGKGTQLAKDKIDALNRLSPDNNYKISIIDLYNAQQEPSGTKINISL